MGAAEERRRHRDGFRRNQQKTSTTGEIVAARNESFEDRKAFTGGQERLRHPEDVVAC